MNLLPRQSLFDMDQLFDNWFSSGLPATENGFFAPRVEVKEKKNRYLITAELPGVKKEDIHVTLENGILTIEAESNQEDKEEKDGKVIRQERRYGKLMRSFSVGNNVKQEDIKAKLDDGLLKLEVPKGKEADQPRRIEIS